MAWNPNIPTVTNRVQDDLAAMRENFQHLAPLAQAVDELQTVSALAPVVDDLQAVSGLAAVAGELQAVSELAPYVQAILGTRIVDHNLDVPNPPNGWYVRWENGLQVCWRAISLPEFIGPKDYVVTNVAFPAAFVSAPIVIASLINRNYADDVTPPQAHDITGTTFSVGGRLFTVGLERQYTIHVFAIGAWK